MAELTTLTLGTDTGSAPLPTAPTNVKDGPNGGVVVDPNSVPAATADKPAAEKLSYEEMEKKYNELRTKMSREGAPKAEAPAAEAPKTETPAVTPPTTEAAQKAATDAGLDLRALEKEYAEKGALSEESLKALEAKGMSRAQVNSYIEGQKAIAANLRTSFAEIAGGEDNLKSVLEWANSNLTKAESAAYNAALDSGNVEAAKMLMEGITQRYVRANGSEPKLVTAGTATRTGGVQPFANSAEIAAAFADPRYKNQDAAYHREVQARMAVTENFR